MPQANGLAGICTALVKHEDAVYVVNCAEYAMASSMFLEWLDAFVAAWMDGEKPADAARAGLVEWDL